jgi:hypothetical protein
MKTPEDLTKEQKEMLGFYTDKLQSHQSSPCNTDPIFVNAKLDAPLHTSGVEFGFSIWQRHGLIGANRIKYVPKDAMIYAFDFVWDLTNEEGMYANPDMIDSLLIVLAKIQEKLAK